MNTEHALAMRTDCCPTCGSQLRDEAFYDVERYVFIANGQSVRFPPALAKIMSVLWQTRNKGGVPNLERFAIALYADRPDGGPEYFNCISVQLNLLRKKIEPLGYTITKNFGTPRLGFRLVKMEPA